jgi:hypothetical protein
VTIVDEVAFAERNRQRALEAAEVLRTPGLVQRGDAPVSTASSAIIVSHFVSSNTNLLLKPKAHDKSPYVSAEMS